MDNSDYLKKYSKNVTQWQPPLHNELFIFLKQAWPYNSLRWDEAHWKWKFFNNPNNRDALAPFFIYKSNNQILGCIGLMPVVIKVAAQEINACWGVNLMTIPEARGRGVGVFLIQKWIDYAHHCLGTGITDDAFAIYKKLKWLCLDGIPTYILVTNPLSKLKNDGSKLFLKIIKFLFWIFINFCWFLKSFFKNKLIFEKIDSFENTIDEFWARISDKFSIIVKRDKKYLNWRFAQRPDGDYDIFLAKLNGELMGYLVLRVAEDKGVKNGYLIDFLLDPDRMCMFPDFIRMAIKYFRKKKVDVVFCLATDKRFQNILKKELFIKKHYATDRIVTNISSNVDFLSDIGKWFITLGDSDQDC